MSIDSGYSGMPFHPTLPGMSYPSLPVHTAVSGYSSVPEAHHSSVAQIENDVEE
jgi:hypothetical protein